MGVLEEDFRSSESWGASTRSCLVTPGGRERKMGEIGERERGRKGGRERESERYGTTTVSQT